MLKAMRWPHSARCRTQFVSTNALHLVGPNDCELTAFASPWCSDSDPEPPPKKRKAAVVKEEEPGGKRSRVKDGGVHANGHADGALRNGRHREDHDGANGRPENGSGRAAAAADEDVRSDRRRSDRREADEPDRRHERSDRQTRGEDLPPPPSRRRDADGEDDLPPPRRGRDADRRGEGGGERARRVDNSEHGDDGGRPRGGGSRRGEETARDRDGVFDKRRKLSRRYADDSDSPRVSRRRRD